MSVRHMPAKMQPRAEEVMCFADAVPCPALAAHASALANGMVLANRQQHSAPVYTEAYRHCSSGSHMQGQLTSADSRSYKRLRG